MGTRLQLSWLPPVTATRFSGGRHRSGIPGNSCRLALLASLFLASHLISARPSLALDGVVDGRSSVQEGQAGPDAYRQVSTQTEVRANQRVQMAGGFQFRADGRIHRELFNSRLGSIRNNLDRRTNQAEASLDRAGRHVGFSLNAVAFDQKTLGAGSEVPLLKRRQIGTSGEYKQRWVRLNAGGLFIGSRREFPLAEALRDEEWSGSFQMRAVVPRLGDVGYRASTLTDRNLNFDSKSTHTSQTLTFAGNSRFAGGRGMVALKTTSGFFAQTQSRSMGGSADRIVLPHTAGLTLDDSPEVHDPLEAEEMPVAELFDGNRTAPTLVQIGDSAPAVREFGGDYRNIIFDFGEAVDADSVLLYVDHTLLTPEMFRWRLFVSNDPEGRQWEEASGVEIVYREWGVGLQGWAVTFAQPVSARFLKMVDVKLGPTTADLSVTEMEVLVRGDEETDSSRSNTTNHRVGLSLGYQISSGLRAGYDVNYRRRTLTGSSGVLEDVGHAFAAAWNRGIWTLSGRYEIRALEGRQSQSTKARSQNVTIKRGQSQSLLSTLSWSRVRDESPGVDKTSNSLSLGSIWKAAPALSLNQRVTSAWLEDRVANQTATSLVVVTSITGEPVPTVSLELAQSERWVSREAGTGFSRFDDTSFTVGWRPVPLISLQSMVRYQLRDSGEWLTRNSISWEPFSAGSVKTGFSAYHFRDTRTQETQRGGGVQVEWAARPSLTIRGNIEAVALEVAHERNSPLNMEIRGIWRY